METFSECLVKSPEGGGKHHCHYQLGSNLRAITRSDRRRTWEHITGETPPLSGGVGGGGGGVGGLKTLPWIQTKRYLHICTQLC